MLKKTLLAIVLVFIIAGLVRLVQKGVLSSLFKTKNGSSATTANANLGEFNAAVDSLNGINGEHGSHGDKRFEDYATLFDLDTGPTGREDPSRLDLEFSPENAHISNLRSVLGSQSGNDPLDQAARRFADTFDALTTVLEPANVYYTQQNYKDDNFAKGKAMNASIVAAFRAYSKATRDLSNAIDDIKLAQTSKQMADLKAKGEMRGYDVMLVLSQADDILKFVNTEVDEKQDVNKIDFKTLGTYNDKLEATLGDLRQIKDAALNSGADSNTSESLKFYIAESDGFLTEAKGLQRSLRDNQPLANSGIQDSLTREYNNIVDAYNSFVH